MIEKTTCRNCGKEVDRYYDMIDVYCGLGPVCEDHVECSDCGYYYTFSYGCYSEGIKGICDFGWGYDDDLNKVTEIQKQLETHLVKK
jgi:hypothetical protein